MKPAIFIASSEDKEKARIIINRFIRDLQTEEILFQAYCIQMVLETFEETFDIDIRGGYSVQNG